jgi:hypothetical protein
MPELSEEQVRWMRNRFVEAIQRMEKVSAEIVEGREELNRVVDALGGLLAEDETRGGGQP